MGSSQVSSNEKSIKQALLPFVGGLLAAHKRAAGAKKDPGPFEDAASTLLVVQRSKANTAYTFDASNGVGG